MFKTHVCLVSNQAAPNFLPLLDDTLKPQEVILMVTEQMREKANFLQKSITPLGMKVRQETFSATGEFAVLQEQLIKLLDSYQPEEIALNATGGTKWMAITAQEVFRMNGSPVFYMDIDSGSILFLDSEREPLTISGKVKLEQYLHIYGYSIINQGHTVKGLASAQRDLCQQLVAHVVEWGGALGQLNKLASDAEASKSLHVALSALGNYQDQYLEKLLKECTYAQLLTQDKDQISFRSEEARFFANGGWLEEYINSKLNELKRDGLLQDSSQLNLKVQYLSKTENEIDVAFMANNKLHLVECKTKRLTGTYAGSAGTESLYKLDSIRDLGGLGTKSMLVSYRPLGNADAQRAKDLNIKVIQGEQIHNMKEALRAWILNRH